MFFPACFFINGELPALCSVEGAAYFGTHRDALELEHPIPQTAKRLAQADALRAIIARSKLQRRFAAQCRLIKIVGADLRGPEPIPPRRHEAAPHRAVGVGRLHQFLDVAKEAFDAGDLKHAAHGLRPVLIATDGARSARTAGGNPALAEGEAGRDEPRAVGAHPGHEIGVAESLALPGPLDMRVERYPNNPPRHLVGEFRIIAGRDPYAADRQSGHFGDAEDTILPERSRECGRNRGAVELLAQIVDQHDRWNLPQLGGDALAP